MTKVEKSLIGVSLCLLIALGMIAYFYAEQQKDLASARAFSEAKDEVILASNRTIKEAEVRMDERKKVWAERESELAKERAAIKTPADARKRIAKDIPGAAMTEVRRDQLPPEVQAQLPNAPSYTVTTAETTVKLAQALADLTHANESVGKITADNADLRVKLKQEQDKFAAANAKAQKWEKAAKGGSWARRTVSAGKLVVTGALIGWTLGKIFKK
jgi:CRISPR/Cas system-associated exonuclease Cas4 (RecB family)